MVGFTSPFLENSWGLAPLEKSHTIRPPTLGEGNVLIPLIHVENTRPPLPCSLRHLGNFSFTEIRLSKIPALTGKPFVTQHNPLRLSSSWSASPPPQAMRHEQAGGGRDGNEGYVDQEERPADQILAAHHRGKHTEGDDQYHADRHPQGGSEQTEDQPDDEAAGDGQ
jgi:hypothetical protein